MQATDCDETEDEDFCRFQILNKPPDNIKYIMCILGIVPNGLKTKVGLPCSITKIQYFWDLYENFFNIQHHFTNIQACIQAKQLFSSYTHLKLRSSCSSTLRHRKQKLTRIQFWTYWWFKEWYHILYTVYKYLDIIYIIYIFISISFFKAFITMTKTHWPIDPFIHTPILWTDAFKQV
jgi:hypothetical protein